MRIAFAGNPNSGKTTMYNALTGRSEKVGNWGGVTVGSKGFKIKDEYSGGKDVIAVDLPGAYSMSPFTPEEGITSEYVRTSNPDAIINIVDATNLSRSLFFTTQLLELGIPVVVALNKSDINEKEGTKIDVAKLSERLGCSVFETTSTECKGLSDVISKAISLAGSKQDAPYIQADINLHDKAAVDAEDRKRYKFVNEIVDTVEKREQLSSETTGSDKADAVLTNPIVGIIIFALVMWGVFWVSQAALGPAIADWLVGWIEMFQEWVAGKLENSPAIISTILADGIVGGGGANTVATTMGMTAVAALAYLFFNLYTPPCFAAIGAMNSEMQSRGWLWGAIGLQLGTGYTVAFLVYQIGTLLTEGHLGTGFLPGLIAVLCMAAAVYFIGKKTRAHFDEQYQLHRNDGKHGAVA